MTQSNDHEKIVERLEFIRASIAKYEGKIAPLRAEETELVIAQSVIARLSGSEKPTEAIEHATHFKKAIPHKKKASKNNGTDRPTGSPTTPEMIKDVIVAEMKSGGVGLANKDLVARIDSKWWPGVDPNYIIPTAWRLAKEGRLGKIGDKYTMPNAGQGKIDFGKEAA